MSVDHALRTLRAALVGHANGRRGRLRFCWLPGVRALRRRPLGRRRLWSLWLCLTGLLAASCAGLPSGPIMVDCRALGLAPVTDPNQRIDFPGEGFSIQAPRGDHWCVLQTHPGWIFFAKNLLGWKLLHGPPPLVERAHTFGAGAMVVFVEGVKLETLAQVQEFTQRWLRTGAGSRIVGSRQVLDPSPVPRSKHISSKIRPDKSLGADCVHPEAAREERDNPRAPDIVFTQTDEGYLCLHPRTSALILIILATERYAQGDVPLAGTLRQEGEAVARDILFASPR